MLFLWLPLVVSRFSFVDDNDDGGGGGDGGCSANAGEGSCCSCWLLVMPGTDVYNKQQHDNIIMS